MISVVEFDKDENIIDIINYKDMDDAYYQVKSLDPSISIERLWYNLTTFGILYINLYLAIDMEHTSLYNQIELMRRIRVFTRNQKIDEIL